MAKKKKEEEPVMLAIEIGKNGYLSVWCPFCVQMHHHGQEEGHVVSHCTNEDSPFNKTGYIVKKKKIKGKNVILQ